MYIMGLKYFRGCKYFMGVIYGYMDKMYGCMDVWIYEYMDVWIYKYMIYGYMNVYNIFLECPAYQGKHVSRQF